MKRWVQLLIVAICVFLLLLEAAPVFAISSISNTFSASKYTISTGQTVSFQAKTTYSWIYFPNPYTSNFVVEVNAYHFNRPVTTSGNVPNPSNWVYYYSGNYTSPAWRYWSRKFWIISTWEAYLNFNAVAKAAASGSKRGHYHGQCRALDWGISYWYPAWVYTTYS